MAKSAFLCIFTTKIVQFLNADFEVIGTCIISNRGEFAIIIIGISYFLPNANILQCVPITQLFRNKEILINSTFLSRGVDAVFLRSSLGVLSVK